MNSTEARLERIERQLAVIATALEPGEQDEEARPMDDLLSLLSSLVDGMTDIRAELRGLRSTVSGLSRGQAGELSTAA